jgi:hypothetical protein
VSLSEATKLYARYNMQGETQPFTVTLWGRWAERNVPYPSPAPLRQPFGLRHRQPDPRVRPLCGASTRSIRFAAVALIRRPMHDGQNPRPLQLNATSRLSPHPWHLRRAKPRQSSPQSR